MIRVSNIRHAAVLCLSVTAGLLLATCTQQSPHTSGSVVLDIEDAPSSRSFASEANMTIDRYEIEGLHSVNGQAVLRTFAATEVASGPVRIGVLSPGSWSFAVYAYNGVSEQTIPIYSAYVSDVTVIPDADTQASAVLSPLGGDGTLSIEFEWPTDVADSPHVTATLRSVDNSIVSGFPVSGDSSSGQFLFSEQPLESSSRASFATNVAAGYYTIETVLDDLSTGGAPLWTNAGDAVRVVYGYNTLVSINLETGSIDIEVTVDRQDPIEISLSGVSGPITTSETVQVTAIATGGSTAHTYHWYVEGALNQTTPDVSVDDGNRSADTYDLGGLSPGRYRLSVLVTDGSVLGSAWIPIDVTS